MPKVDARTNPPRSKTHRAFAQNLAAVIAATGQSVTAWSVQRKLQARNIQRILNGEQSPSLDSMEDIARACGLEPWQMLMPGIDLSNPPVFVMSQTEAELYDRLRAGFASLPKR